MDKMRELALPFSVLIALNAGAALAADLPTHKSAPAPIVATTAFSWAGLYVGVQAGGDWGSVFGPFGNASQTGFGPYTVDPAGVLLGGYAGYNLQWQSLVLGVEGDFNGVVGSDTTRHNVLWNGTTLYDIGASQPWTGDARLRAGYAIDRLLLYVAGGAAFGEVHTHYAIAGSPPAVFETTDRVGWTIGGGAEYAFTNSIVGRVEYRYTDLGSRSFTNVTENVYDNVRFTSNTVLVGLGYKF
jgi:outer membrane immunogenic protein